MTAPAKENAPHPVAARGEHKKEEVTGPMVSQHRLVDQLHARRRHALRCEPLECGRRDPATPQPLQPPSLATALHILSIGGTLSRDVAAMLWKECPSRRREVEAYAHAHLAGWAA